VTSQHDIFIHPGHPEEALMADVAMASGGRLRPVAQGPVNYSANLIDTALELQLAHDFEEDKGIPFERYQAVVTVRNFAGNKDRERATADRVFHELAAMRKYWLVLVFDLQMVLETAAPPGRTPFPPVSSA
jgi:hypothetical protein